MPIYEYRCDACGKTVEKIQREVAETVACPHCGGEARRAVSVFAGKAQNAPGAGGGCAPGSGFR